MAERLGLGSDVHELRIGQSFTNPRNSTFHSIRYDFKPASVDTGKNATVDVGQNNQVTVTVPHLDGAGTAQTVFKGSQRPYTKECVLIFDKVTGHITLEKLSSNIQLKKTRNEFSQKSSSTASPATSALREQTPPQQQQQQQQPQPTIGQRISHKTKVTSGSRRPDRPITQLVPKHSPLHASPAYPSSPGHRVPLEASGVQSTLASLPLIGLDDYSPPPAAPPASAKPAAAASSRAAPPPAPAVAQMSDSSSSSSSDSDESDLDEDAAAAAVVSAVPVLPANGVGKMNHHNSNSHHNNNNNNNSTSSHLLKEDLCLSESGSDSD